jgi:hypothetical protein
MSTSRPFVPSLLLTLLVALGPACTDDSGAEAEGAGTEEGGEEPGALLATDFDASAICGGQIERLEFSTRRRDCWDPEIPCTLPQDPPWITGTGIDCAELGGSMRWEVRVTQTGKWETQLRALAGGVQEGVHCFAPTGEGRTNVANADLDSNAEFVLVEVADGECSAP